MQLWSHDQQMQIEHCLLISQWLTEIKGRYDLPVRACVCVWPISMKQSFSVYYLFILSDHYYLARIIILVKAFVGVKTCIPSQVSSKRIWCVIAIVAVVHVCASFRLLMPSSFPTHDISAKPEPPLVI